MKYIYFVFILIFLNGCCSPVKLEKLEINNEKYLRYRYDRCLDRDIPVLIERKPSLYEMLR